MCSSPRKDDNSPLAVGVARSEKIIVKHVVRENKVRKKKYMKGNGSQPLNLIRKSNNIAEMLRKDCSFSWTFKIKCLF